ncbi:MAG: Mur ligase family protein, partial [Chloroflexota bacterium]|nr:Mur ligase family protein [Chloroflexota bacterium]
MSYAAAVADLQRRGRFRVRLGLERMERLLAALDHPERPLRGALVGGTNGKGSVVALVASALTAAGLRVGTMPSPHLVSYRERIAVGGTPLTERAFAAAVSRVRPGVDRVTRTLGDPTEFEFLTAAAIAEFAAARVDAAIVEVGMGGRLDATNVLDLGVTAITNVQHDHERHLGRTLGAIAREKAAIIKRGDLAVTGARGTGLAVIADHCIQLGVPLRRAGGARDRYRARVSGIGWD